MIAIKDYVQFIVLVYCIAKVIIPTKRPCIVLCTSPFLLTSQKSLKAVSESVLVIWNKLTYFALTFCCFIWDLKVTLIAVLAIWVVWSLFLILISGGVFIRHGKKDDKENQQ